LSNSYLKFWGTRGSNPSPDSDKMKYGGDTSCIEIMIKNKESLILDMGTGMRNLGKEIIADSNYPKEINILLSHFHFDHIMGFLTFAPLFNNNYTINIYGKNSNTSVESAMNFLLKSDFWPVDMDMINAQLNFKSWEANTFNIKNAEICHALHGHPNGANSYKIKVDNFNIVYATDLEHPEGKLNNNVVNLSKDADILIHDSHFSINDLVKHKGWGHSSWKQAADVAIESKTKKLILFHHSPDYSDDKVHEIEKNAQKKFPNTISAYQGLKINF